MNKSEALFERAKKVMPGGVNSPVRAFNAVGGSPKFIASAKGARLFDEDGAEYIDFIGSWGPMILGHATSNVLDAVAQTMQHGLSFGAATRLEVEMAELICSIVKNVDMVRMVNSGTEAVMSAIRLARGYTGREKVVKFAGCYHGHCDAMLVKAGSGAMTNGNPDSGGVTRGAAQDTLIATYNNLDSVRKLFAENKGEIAAVIIEPAAANMGVIAPNEDFLISLRKLCDENSALLIFDEVITGFRLALGGAQEFFDIDADIVTFGKIIGAGMPVGAYGARREIMECVSPLGGVYQAGTLSGNPVAMAAGLASLRELQANSSIYGEINVMAQTLAAGLRGALGGQVNQVGSLVCAFFTETPVVDFETAKTSDTSKYSRYFNHMLSSGVYIAPAQFEAMFISAAHTAQDINVAVNAATEFAKL